MRYYSGVGSRKTPVDVLATMKTLAMELEVKGYVLRSGGAEGADKAFESGTLVKDIYYANQATPAAMSIAAAFHPAWGRCSAYAQRLHGRNAFQVLGSDLMTPSKFLICWTPDGCECHAERSSKTGGTGTAISIAEHYGVPVFNLFHDTTYTHLIRFINK